MSLARHSKTLIHKAIIDMLNTPNGDLTQLPLAFAPLDCVTVEEIWRAATAEMLANLKEDRRIERKPVGIHGRELAEYFSMWANTVDGGLIVVGMEDDGTVSGCAMKDGYSARLEGQARDNCPDARTECRTVKAMLTTGTPDYLLLIRVHYNEARVVKTSAGDAFIRVGHQKRRLKHEEVRELESDKGQVDVEQEPCPSVTYPADFDEDILNDFIQNVRVRTAYRDDMTIPEVLELRRLGRRRGRVFIPNAACVLLFARDPCRLFPGCKIRFLRHEGEIEGTGTKWNVVKDILMEGAIPILIAMAERALNDQLREFSRLGDNGKFFTAPEYPRGAWLEAVVNACAHRSYGTLKNMNVFVRMFDDRLEIESPGGFPPPVTPDNIYEMHHPRNPILMDAMMFMDYVKCAREGTRRMRDTMAASELPPPHFAQKEASYALVKVTLKNNIKQRKFWLDADASSAIGEDVAKTLSPAERRAVNFVAEHGRAHVTEIAELLDIHWKTAQRLLVKMAHRRILHWIHRTDIVRDPNAHFVLAVKRRRASQSEKANGINKK